MSRIRHFEAAVAAVATSLEKLPGSLVELNRSDLREYSQRGFVAGWRLTVGFPGGDRRLDLLVDDWFPRSAPSVALVDRPHFLAWPHVERDGVLCLLPNTASVDPSNPVGAANATLGSACTLIQDCIAGINVDEFRQEFLSYWSWGLPKGHETFFNLLAPAAPTRSIRVWYGKAFALLGDSDADISRWLANRRGEKYANDSSASGIFLWLDAALIPSEYPHSGADLLQLVRRAGGGDLIDQLVQENPSRIVIAVGAPTSNGPCLAAVTAVRPQTGGRPGRRGRSNVEDGFRKGKVPPEILTPRYVGGAQIVRSPVERVDAAWIHGRNDSSDLARLQAARVVVLGCGSVGAPVALALIQAGVSTMALIDPDTLKWSNTTRHPLGAAFVDRNKAEALAEHIRQNYPHIGDVSFHATRWQDVLRTSPDVFRTATVVVSAMGEWEAEGAFNEWHVASGRTFPVIYGWTEPHACAGHAVAVCREGGCFNCGTDNFGTALSNVTKWSSSTLRQEPACGASYQPYGAIALMHIVAGIGQVVLKHLTRDISESSESVWAGDQALLDACGGNWAAGAHAPNSFVERPWVRRTDCPTCA